MPAMKDCNNYHTILLPEFESKKKVRKEGKKKNWVKGESYPFEPFR